jgi:hypothetical protein
VSQRFIFQISWKILKVKDWSDPQPDSAIQPKARGLLHMECKYFTHHIWSRFRGLSTSQPRSNQKYLEDYSTKDQKQPEGSSDYLKYSKTSGQVLDACRTRLRRARGLVRPGAAGLLIGIECFRVRDSSWIYLTCIVTTQIGVGLDAVQRKLPDRAVVGLQLYSARTFYVNLSPQIYKGGQVPPQNHQHLRQYKPPHRT